MRNSIWGGVAVAVLAGAAQAGPDSVFFSELFHNGPGADQGQEFLEIAGPAGMALTGWKFIVIEADDTDGAGPAGTADQIIDLSAYTIGSNGLLLIRDSADVLQPPPAAETTVVVLDFTPDIENGANTYVIGSGTVGFTTGTDLDVGNDGALDDLSLWSDFTVADAFSYTDPAELDKVYADDLGGTVLGGDGSPGEFFIETITRLINASFNPVDFAGGDATGTPPGPYGYEPSRVFGFEEHGLDPLDYQLSPGNWGPVVHDGGCVGVTISDQPDTFTGRVGDTITLVVGATGTGPFDYQWRKGGTDLSDGGRVSGATADTLTITGAGINDSGSYDVVVTNDCGEATSDAATVTIACPPDCNGDGNLNINDFICFQGEWRRMTAYGDYNDDGRWNINDFIAFQADFQRTLSGGGCRR